MRHTSFLAQSIYEIAAELGISPDKMVTLQADARELAYEAASADGILADTKSQSFQERVGNGQGGWHQGGKGLRNGNGGGKNGGGQFGTDCTMAPASATTYGCTNLPPRFITFSKPAELPSPPVFFDPVLGYNRTMSKILIIEDEAELVKVLRSYLEKAGFEVISAYQGDTGLETWRSAKPDLVILDLNLPGMDGLDVARSIRRELIPRSSWSPPGWKRLTN